MEAFDFFRLVAVIAAFFSAFAVVLTVYDKLAAKRHKRRIPEKTLLLAGILGGAVFEWITMKIIHHKTLHKKFMIGLPLMMIFQAAVLSVAYLYFFR